MLYPELQLQTNKIQEEEGKSSKRWADVSGRFNPKKRKQRLREVVSKHFLFENSGTESLERAKAERAAEAALGSRMC